MFDSFFFFSLTTAVEDVFLFSCVFLVQKQTLLQTLNDNHNSQQHQQQQQHGLFPSLDQGGRGGGAKEGNQKCRDTLIRTHTFRLVCDGFQEFYSP